MQTRIASWCLFIQMKATTSPVSQWCCHSWPNVNPPNGIDLKMKNWKLNIPAEKCLLKWKQHQEQFHSDVITVCQTSTKWHRPLNKKIKAHFASWSMFIQMKVTTRLGFTTMLSQLAKCHSAKWYWALNKNLKLTLPPDDYLFKWNGALPPTWWRYQSQA